MIRVGRSTLDTVQRVQEFLSQHPLADAGESFGAQATELDDVAQKLSDEMVAQEASKRFARVHTEYERRLRKTIYIDHLRPISRVAQDVFGESAMDKAFRMPRARHVSQPLIAAARAMAEAAENEKDVFLRYALAPDFVEQLRAVASELEKTRTAKTESVRRRSMATALVKEHIKNGNRVLRLLDAVLVPRFKKDPELLATWKRARKVRPTASPVAAEPADAALKVA